MPEIDANYGYAAAASLVYSTEQGAVASNGYDNINGCVRCPFFDDFDTSSVQGFDKGKFAFQMLTGMVFNVYGGSHKG